MASILPDISRGHLPYFLLWMSVSAVAHSAFSYLSPPSTALVQFRGPRAPPPHSLLAHVYAVKNVYTGLIRMYAAYYIKNPQVYALGIASFAGPLFLFLTELVVYRTVRIREAMFPFLQAGGGLLWMMLARENYLG